MAAKKTRKAPAGTTVKESGFTFRLVQPRLWEVYRGNRLLGRVASEVYRGTRYCFRIDGDRNRPTRYYRGRTMVADALLKMDQLKTLARKNKWSTDQLIMAAWNRPPIVALNARRPAKKRK